MNKSLKQEPPKCCFLTRNQNAMKFIQMYCSSEANARRFWPNLDRESSVVICRFLQMGKPEEKNNLWDVHGT